MRALWLPTVSVLLVDNDLDGYTVPHCATLPCASSGDCTLGGLLPDSDCDPFFPGGPVCTWFCQDSPCPDGFVWAETLIPADGQVVSQWNCELN